MTEPVVHYHGRQGGGAGGNEARPPASTACWAALALGLRSVDEPPLWCLPNVEDLLICQAIRELVRVQKRLLVEGDIDTKAVAVSTSGEPARRAREGHHVASPIRGITEQIIQIPIPGLAVAG